MHRHAAAGGRRLRHAAGGVARAPAAAHGRLQLLRGRRGAREGLLRQRLRCLAHGRAAGGGRTAAPGDAVAPRRLPRARRLGDGGERRRVGRGLEAVRQRDPAHSTLTGCTTLLLTSEHADRPVSAEHTMVDGILLLRERAFGPRRERNIEVVKFRGSQTLRGNHAFQITAEGVTIYPRLEAQRRDGAGDAVLSEGVPSGVGGLDAMFDIGGYARGSVTVVTGPSGSGKTSFGLHFLAAAAADESALYVSFYESPELLARTMQVQASRGPRSSPASRSSSCGSPSARTCSTRWWRACWRGCAAAARRGW
ncbi:hypothetical protein HK414_08250 [Ramlibacter terrae]|uniref:KaiC-like domain-containing protein n=1 Tax=Ramlibacter terrae TaxID=2732511 RepID=A0ABX6P1L2_9BURK|nr:hypothetical protein HK414_08250 [Ramlibacter terrae]